MKNEQTAILFEELLNYGLELIGKAGRLEREIAEQEQYIQRLEKENRELKYEYNDSKLNRDKPIPYKWMKIDRDFRMFCPKCEMSIGNWYRYCNSCGQKIGQGNPLPEMEIRKNG